MASTKSAPRPATVSTRPPAVIKLPVTTRGSGVIHRHARNHFGGLDAADDPAGFRGLGIAARRHHHTDHAILSNPDRRLAKLARRRGDQNRQQRLVDERQHGLRLRITETHVELDHLRAGRGQHQTDEQEAAERMSFLRHPGDHRFDDLAHHAATRAPHQPAGSAQRRPSRRCSVRDRRRRCACDPAPIRSAPPARRRTRRRTTLRDRTDTPRRRPDLPPRRTCGLASPPQWPLRRSADRQR